jgi:hypothetical protein
MQCTGDTVSNKVNKNKNKIPERNVWITIQKMQYSIVRFSSSRVPCVQRFRGLAALTMRCDKPMLDFSCFVQSQFQSRTWATLRQPSIHPFGSWMTIWNVDKIHPPLRPLTVIFPSCQCFLFYVFVGIVDDVHVLQDGLLCSRKNINYSCSTISDVSLADNTVPCSCSLLAGSYWTYIVYSKYLNCMHQYLTSHMLVQYFSLHITTRCYKK